MDFVCENGTVGESACIRERGDCVCVRESCSVHVREQGSWGGCERLEVSVFLCVAGGTQEALHVRLRA